MSAGEGSETPAVEYVAKVGETKYETLQAAINAAKSGSTVRLLANVTLTEAAVFPAGKTVHQSVGPQHYGHGYGAAHQRHDGHSKHGQ